MTQLTRTWLRRIALGLPLLGALPLGGCTGARSSCDGFDPQERRDIFVPTDDTRAAIARGELTCNEVCATLGADAGIGSAVDLARALA